MRFRVLGGVEALKNGQSVDIGHRRMDRYVLGLLLLDLGTVVPTDRLIDLLWDGEGPDRARAGLQVHISRIRKALAGAGAGEHGFRIQTRGNGYVLDGDPERVDVHWFRSLYDRALAVPSPAARSRLLREALDLWQGPPLGDVATDRFRRTGGARLDELHLTAVEERIRAELDLGRHDGALAEEAPHGARHPLRESLIELRMLALYRAGRPAEALAVYAEARERLVEATGLDPRRELDQLRDQIARADPALDLAPADAARRVPGQLPPGVVDFTGRGAELRALDRLLADQGTSVLITTIAGTGGVGKTALALHWAHLIRDRFPDGQLYLNLHGYSSTAPLRPIDAIARLLRALDVPADTIPTEVDEASALYRAVLADRRVLIVLDNVNHPDQVRPLLPAGDGSLALVTSRDRLSGLTARDGARRLSLGVLDPADSLDLLGRIVGADRVAAERAAAAELVALCGYLPLAVRITAALLADQPDRSVAEHAAELRAGGRLAALQVEDDEQASVTAAFAQSYRRLTADQARLFRFLGLVPGPDFTEEVAAALTDGTAAGAGRLLDRLAAAHLVEAHGDERYAFHDLLREYAGGLCETEDPAAERDAAIGRLTDHYLHASAAAMDVLVPHERQRRPQLPPPTVPARSVPDPEGALSWLDAERPNLLAAAGRYPAATGLLSRILSAYLDSHGHRTDALALHGHALRVAREEGDPGGQAAALLLLGGVYWRLSRFGPAAEHHGQALIRYREVGDRTGEGRALNNLGIVYGRWGRYEQAAERFQQALALSREVGDRAYEGRVLNNLGIVYGRWGRFELAAEHYRQALTLNHEGGDRTGEGRVLNNLGLTYGRWGRFDRAVEYYDRALALYTEVGDQAGEGNTRANLGVAHTRSGRYAEAHTHLHAALDLHRGVGDRAGEGEALIYLGVLLRRQGDHAGALAALLPALDLVRELGERDLESGALNALGEALRADGRPAEALGHHRAALEIAEDIGNYLHRAYALDGLGHALHALGEDGEAEAHWRRALRLYEEMDLPEAEAVRLAVLGVHP